MKGRIVLITGANSGIGRATALALAGMGARIVMLTRNSQGGLKAMKEIKEESGNPDIDLITADLSIQAEVHRAAAEFAAKYDRLHVLINNAGGLEQTLAVNYLAPFLLTNLLLDRLKADAPSRVINVASGLQRAVYFHDLQAENGYNGFRVYGQSKAALILFTAELARRLAGSGITANSVHPGGVRTGLWRHSGSFVKLMIKMAGPMLKSPEEGAETPVYLASSDEMENISSRYFVKRRAVRPSAAARDDSAARRLWDISVMLTGLNENKEE